MPDSSQPITAKSVTFSFREARSSDLTEIVRMLANDTLGAGREQFTEPLHAGYLQAFARIENDRNNQILLAVDAEDRILGFLQLTYIPNLTYQGSWRAQIEGVRVNENFRSSGIGKAIIEYALHCARARGCYLAQLTSDKSRTDALRFYESLGFKASHEGFKRML